MVLYSPSHEGGTLHLPSPTHCHTFDATSTLLQLRRSLSRSPSKSPAFRLVTTKAQSPNGRLALSPSPLSPHRHVSRLQLPGIASTHSQHSAHAKSPPHSPLGIDMPASQRTTRVAVRKYSPLRPTTTSRAHVLGRTPAPRRILGESMDTGNVLPTPAQDLVPGNENAPTSALSIVQPPKVEFKGFGSDYTQITDPTATTNDNSFSTTPHSFQFRSDRHQMHLSEAPVKSSPLKRADAPSKTDPSEGSSPSAKRRSLHGASDFDIFDQFKSATSGAPRVSPEYVPVSPMDTHAKKVIQASPIQKRAASLRKTTLQQRHQDRPVLTRAKASVNLQRDTSNSPAVQPRKSTDAERSLPTRRNLFSDEHPVDNAPAPSNLTNMDPPRAPARHPLSRTINQSPSGSETAQDSPTHMPICAPERRMQGVFARSLPIGLGRNRAQLRQAGDDSDTPEVSTPANIRDVKPEPAAFMSTGLISKKTKYLQDQARGEVKNMPDTPCKRPMPINPLAPGATPAPAPRHTQLRRSQHSFGSPSTPFNAGTSQQTAGAMGKGVGIFGSTVRPLNRRGSFLRVDSEEFLSTEMDANNPTSFEVADSPSKDDSGSAPESNSFNPRDSIFGVSFPNRDDFGEEATDDFESPRADVACKLVLSSPDGLTLDADGDSMMQESPSAHRRFSSLGALASYSSHRRPSILAGDHSPSPTPHSKKSFTLPHIRTSNMNAKSPAPPASPLFERSQHRLPHTPRDSQTSEAPPDPSGLSISGQAQQTVDFRKAQFGQAQFGQAHFGQSSSFGASLPPPATPTANRDSSRFQSSRIAKTSASAIAEAQADSSLKQRFDEIEMIGEGEFSSVFKVTNKQNGESTSGKSYFDSPSSNISTPASKRSLHRVSAVKKARYPFKSVKDRLNKLKEVDALRALGSSDHIITFQDHWEYDSHLYIQTEFCDEGSLDKFLSDAGRAARLDDFRIWKILLEVGLGVKYIHDSGYIHLDLKPANILITFEGTLKIADFGMATSWPAQRGHDGEGDREYIGPEVLQGKFDKPADIYALGLIMLEIAANVVLPDSGASWQRLRSGDMSDVPSLTSSSDVSLPRDASGRVIELQDTVVVGDDEVRPPIPTLLVPPAFMSSKEDVDSLDQLVSCMISEDPEVRPTVDGILQAAGVQWVAERRRAGATVYEGTWGPADEVLAQDAEMIDV